MTTYASKEWIFWRLDSLIKYHKDGSILLSGLMVGGLQELFDGDQAPYIEFGGLRCEGGKLIATVVPPEGEDAEEWCAALQEFVEDRFVVESYEPKASPWHSIVEQYGTPTRHGAYAKTYEESQEVLKALEARLWEKAKASMAASSK